MRYAKILQHGVLIKETPTDGYKPVEVSEPEQRKYYKAYSHFEDAGDKAILVWEYVEMSEEEKAEVDNPDIDDAEAFDIIFGGVE